MTNFNRVAEGREQPVVQCKYCGKITEIKQCRIWETMITHYKTMKEELSEANKRILGVRINKNGQIQALHKLIGELLKLMTPEQRETAMKLHQHMRDEIKMLKV